jgi:TRAP-type C4-dicarboxylate transport system permease small subunit
MDFIDRMLPRRLGEAWMRLMHAACAAILLFLSWQIWIKAGRIAEYGDTTDVLRIGIAPFVYFMTVMIALTGLVHVLKIFLPQRRREQRGSA